MREAILTEVIGNYRVNVYYDEDYGNPRTEWDNASHMVIRSRYISSESDKVEATINRLCDKYGIDNEDMDFLEVLDALNEYIVIMPITLYVHSGMTVWYGKPTCPWDSGYVGFGYMEHSDLYSDMCGRNKTRYPSWRDQCEAVMNDEMHTFDYAVRGAVYGYEIETLDGEFVDSCWGFYGHEDEVMDEALKCVPPQESVVA